MSKKPIATITVRLDKIIGGGQAIGTMDDGRKVLTWGGLPGELVTVQPTKKKSSYLEGIVTEVLEASDERVAPKDQGSYLSTSPWQILSFEAEQRYKAALVHEAFELHGLPLPSPVSIDTDNNDYGYRNKMEFSFWWDKDREELDLAFFKRGSHTKVPVEGSSLASSVLNGAALRIRDILRARNHEAYNFKTVIVRSTQQGEIVAQLYVKVPDYPLLHDDEIYSLGVQGFELIYSDPKSPASIISRRLQTYRNTTLTDNIMDVPFTYAAESFFQVNLQVYERALRDIRSWVDQEKPTLDLYSGVGTIGLTVTSGPLVMVEINEPAVRESLKTIESLKRPFPAQAILSSSESALDHITTDKTIIVDPPRAGLHSAVIERLLMSLPSTIIYLSCNPVTQARDVAFLQGAYAITSHKGFNFFPRTPHIEHLVILERK